MQRMFTQANEVFLKSFSNHQHEGNQHKTFLEDIKCINLSNHLLASPKS